MYRLVVAYELAADGALLPVGPPSARVPATGEGLLYRSIAACAEADDAAIVAAASHFGPLGPTGVTASIGDERTVGWLLGGRMSDLFADMSELDRWLASGGGITVSIPARLSTAAYVVVSFACMEPEMLTALLRLTEDERLPSETRAHTRARLWEEGLAALARYEAMIEANPSNPALGDEPVRVLVPPSITAQRLRLTRRLLLTTWRAMGRDGGPGAVLEHGSLGRFATLLSQYAGVQQTPLMPPENVNAWRTAAAELATWQEAVRLLRALAAGHTVAPMLRPVLTNLCGFAGISNCEGSRRPPAAADAHDQLRGEAASLLTLRLQQLDAWPLPEEEAVGAFGRALWSLWPPITGKQPDRRCQWREGCPRLLPDDGHGNRRYCEVHRKEAARERAQRNRNRRRADRPAEGIAASCPT
jgi:hypothetical protein